MIKVIVLKDCRGYKAGSVVRVNPNEAHSLIDSDCAKLYKEELEVDTYEDKMMRPKYIKKRRTKWLTE